MQTSDFTKGKILGPLLKFALPVFLAMLLQSLYGAVDLLVVGRFSDAANVSAVATGAQIMQTITAVIVGISMGTTVLLGQLIGIGRPEKAGETVGASIVLFALLGAGVTAVMLFASEGVAALMHAPEAAFRQTADYIGICSDGAVFIVAYNLIGSIFRGIGNSRMPLVTVAIAAVLNVFGDLLLVAVFHMGAAGAALATVFSQAVSVVLSFLIIRRARLPFSFSKKEIRFNGPVIRKVLALGFPIALEDLLVSISFLIIMAIVNSIGVVASAGVGVAERLCAFVMLVPSAFMQSMSAFVAQNYGAGRFDRAVKALRCGITASLCCGVVLGYLSFFHGDLLSAVFTTDAAVAAASADYLKAYAIDCLLTSFLFCFMGFYNGLGETKFVMVQGIIGAFCVRVPVSYLMSLAQPVSLFRIGLATPCSSAVQILLCFLFFRFRFRRKKPSSGGTDLPA